METHEHCISSIPYRGDTVTCSAYLPNYYFLRFGNLGGKAVAEEASVGRRTPQYTPPPKYQQSERRGIREAGTMEIGLELPENMQVEDLPNMQIEYAAACK